MLRKFKRIISFLLISTMMLAMVPEIPAYAGGDRGKNLVPTIESDGQVTFYYQGEGAREVYVKGSWGWDDKDKHFFMTETENGFWSVTSQGLEPGTSYEYGIVVDGEWYSPQPNASINGSNPKIIRNPNVNVDGTVTFYYYPSMGENASDIKVKYKNQDSVESEVGFAQDATYNTIYSATTEPLNGTYDYVLSVSGNDLANYNSDSSTFTAGNAPKENPDTKSPVVDKDKVTFYYYAPIAKEVKLAGLITSWDPAYALVMDYDSATGYWSTTLTEQKNGNYEYKFIVDGNFKLDPLNENIKSGNSAYTVTDGFVPELVSPFVDISQVTFSYKGAPEDTVVLSGDMNGWANEGADADKMTEYDEKTGVWSITKRLAPGEYEYKFVVNGTYINDPLNIDALKENGNNVVTVQDYYTYNVYYYDTKHTELTDSSLWVWEDGGKHEKEHFYSSKEVINGYTWLKAEVDLPYTKIGIIPKDYKTWDWEDTKKFYELSEDKQTADIYLIYQVPKLYTECPDLSTMELPKDRYIIVDYTRENGDYNGWNIYTWNSGYGSDVSVPFKEVNGRWVATVPVSPGTSTLSFCVRKSVGEDAWAEKDGGDHAVTITDTQTVTKARFTQGKGVEETLPDNIGFEIKPKEEKVMFYYRDDTRFLTDTQKELIGKVQIGIDMPDTNISTFSSPQLCDMTYDEKNERFQYAHESLTNGEHSYYYMIDGVRVLDAFNSRVNNAGDANIYDYYTFNTDFAAKLKYPTMDYNDNNLLSVLMDNKEGTADALKVVEAYADLSQLGGGITAISPELMELSIGVLHTITPGTKVIPVVVKDQYGNEYTAETTVEVKEKSTDDFDWDEAIIYFTLTDRFFDGNSGNNNAYGIDDYNIGEGGNLSYHGGDFAGLIQKLDYLQEMGVNTVWITPIVENYMADGLTTDDATIKSYGYHGYWASDFEKLNRHLGTEEELSALVRELHNRDMKLMVDVVLNHSGYDTDGNNVTDFFNTKLNGKKMLRDNTNTVPKHDILDALAGLPDFVTEDAEVRDLLIEWQASWVSKYDID